MKTAVVSPDIVISQLYGGGGNAGSVYRNDFIELFNRSATYSFDLSGWRLNGVDFTFPQGTIITNRGLLVVCKDRAAFGNAYGWGSVRTLGVLALWGWKLIGGKS